MNLFIRVQDGQPFEHPMLEENFRAAFPDVDTENLPPEFARFTRVAPPALSAYEVYEGVTYERFGDGFTDTHHVRLMTDAERLDKQNATKAYWAENGFSSWVFDEELCAFISPVPYPQGGSMYAWDETTTSWIEVQPPQVPA